MNINNEFFGLLQEQNILKTTKTKPLVDAIQNRHPVTFYYSGPRKPKKTSVKAGRRINAEIVALGLSKKGNLIVRAYVAPPSVSKRGFNEHGWRTFMVSRMNSVDINKNETFDIKRPGYKEGEESSGSPMEVTYVTTNWDKKSKVVKTKKVNPVVKQPQNQPEPVIPDDKPKQTELPQIKKKSKPEVINKKTEVPPLPVNPEEPEINQNNDLPPINPEEKPSENPEDDINKNLQEEMKRMKSLISY